MSPRVGGTAPSSNITGGFMLSWAYDGVNSPIEALARAWLLLGFLSETNRMGDWRATIQSLVDYAG